MLWAFKSSFDVDILALLGHLFPKLGKILLVTLSGTLENLKGASLRWALALKANIRLC
jgi:hypothetical protein